MLILSSSFAPALAGAPPTPAAAERSARSATARETAAHDSSLVTRFLAGDEAAFVEIMSRYRERIFRVAFGVLKNQADAEETTQDTFIRAHRGLEKFRGDASLATWLYRIALNLARNRYWYFFRRCRHTTLSLDCQFSDDNQATFAELVAADEAGPVHDAATREFTDLVALCMERLGPQPRRILTLRNSANHSYEEIARELGITIGTVKSRIARARERLRVLLTEACPDFGAEAQPAAWFEPASLAAGAEYLCA